MALDPLGRFAYVANKGDDSISACSIGSNGALAPIPGSHVAAGCHPVDVAVNATGKVACVVNRSSNNVSAYRIGPEGVLTPIPGSPFPVQIEPVAVAITRAVLK